MELLEGEPLSDRLAKGPLPLEQTLRYGVEIADALDKAHRQGIVHRDLKPGNVMITKSGVKLLDFGLAKAMAEPMKPSGATSLPTVMGSANNLTQEGTILGTFQYMAPEQLEGKEADGRTDIFAFGAVLYEMATAKKAFAGATQASLISAILRDDPPPISQVHGDVAAGARPRREDVPGQGSRGSLAVGERPEAGAALARRRVAIRRGSGASPAATFRRPPRARRDRARARGRRRRRRAAAAAASGSAGSGPDVPRRASGSHGQRGTAGCRDLSGRSDDRFRRHGHWRPAPDLAAPPRRARAPGDSRHGRRQDSVLVAGRPEPRLLRRREAAQDRARRRRGRRRSRMLPTPAAGPGAGGT